MKPRGCGTYAVWGFFVLALYGFLGTAGLLIAIVIGVVVFGVLAKKGDAR